MEPTPPPINFRYKLVIGKFDVARVEKTAIGYTFALRFPSLGFLVCEVAGDADVREGDILTLYTEVIAKRDD